MTQAVEQDRTIRVLLVDDHELTRRGLALLLESTPGIRVVGQAGEAAQGIELARDLKPDVVIMDVSMPGVSGVDATRAIKAERPITRVIGLSMHEMDGVRQSMLGAGADDYVTKSAPPEDLLAAIRRTP